MATTEPNAKRRSWTKAARSAFLAKLAETANVAASARAARMPVSSIYALRRKSPDFRCEWSEALAEGYARLEAFLLEAALKKASGAVDQDELRRDAQKHRLGLGLLAQHRPAVKGQTVPVRPADPRALKTMLLARIGEMHDRIEAAKAEDAPQC